MKHTAIRGRAIVLPGNQLYGTVEIAGYFLFFTLETDFSAAADQLISALKSANLEAVGEGEIESRVMPEARNEEQELVYESLQQFGNRIEFVADALPSAGMN